MGQHILTQFTIKVAKALGAGGDDGREMQTCNTKCDFVCG